MKEEETEAEYSPLGDDCYHLRKNSRALNQGSEKAVAPLQYSCLENPMDGGAW